VRLLRVIFATPEALRVTDEPCCTPSTLNVTKPVGVTLPVAGVTVAVKVTGCPKPTVSPDEARMMASRWAQPGQLASLILSL
jgi:hypothetical protein